MDRLAAHVIATAALTVTLATVPVLFADASHAASSPLSAAAPAADPQPQASNDARSDAAALPALPPLDADPQAALPAAAHADPETAAPQAAGPAEAETAPSPAAKPPAAAAEPPAYGAARASRAAAKAHAVHTVHADHRGAHGSMLLHSWGGPCADVRQVGATGHALYHGMIAFSVKEYYSPACRSYYGYTFAWLQFRRLHVRYDVGVAVYDFTRDSIVGARTFLGGAGGPSFWSAAIPAAKGTCTQGEGHYFYYPAGAPGGFEEGDTFTTRTCA